ncbi:MAG: PQQ-dependent sugar dehydrogenase [Flavobacterium sp.]
MKTATTFLSLFCFFICHSQIIGLQSFATGFKNPVEITHAGDDRLFVVEKEGIIKILNPDGTVDPIPFLSVKDQVSTGSEQGLLGLAFHPNFASNGLFYINYTNLNGDTVIKEYSNFSGDDRILLTIPQPYANHNGGSLKFGSDGYLYIGMGDGGSGGDPGNRAQNINELLGKMLRIDVNSGSPYGIPSNNPYVGKNGADEIWAIGLRNPWKFSFDKSNGNLWIADVGQNAIEEINVAPASQAELNYGWRCYEGNSDYNTSGCSPKNSMKFPLATINHSTGACSITGGYVYNGTKYPNFQGLYFFSDYCKPQIGMLKATGEITFSVNFSGNNFSTFGEDQSDELYIASLANGTIYKITDISLSTENFEKTHFVIYPNPTKSEISIQKLNDEYPTEITIFDLNGKLLLHQVTENKKNNTIKTGNLSSGIYILTLKSNQKRFYTQRLIIE